MRAMTLRERPWFNHGLFSFPERLIPVPGGPTNTPTRSLYRDAVAAWHAGEGVVPLE